jgi:hypothetical protein
MKLVRNPREKGDRRDYYPSAAAQPTKVMNALSYAGDAVIR